jgi:enoyl reductase-like protein
MITNDARCTCEIKSTITMAIAVFNRKKAYFTSKLKKLVKCYICSTALYHAEMWMLRAVDQKYQEVLKCYAGEGWRRSIRQIM